LGTATPDAYVVDLKSGDVLQNFGPHGSEVYGLCFVPGSPRVATVSGISDLSTVRFEDCTLRLFDESTGKLLHQATLNGRGSLVLATPDGKELLAGDDLGRIMIFDAATLEPAGELHGLTNETTQVEHSSIAHNQSIRFMGLSADGQRIYTGAGGTRNRLVGNAFAVWGTASLGELGRFAYKRRMDGFDVSVGPDHLGDRLLIVGRKNAEVWLLDPRLGEAQ
jgi:WD40 repeat protein